MTWLLLNKNALFLMKGGSSPEDKYLEKVSLSPNPNNPKEYKFDIPLDWFSGNNRPGTMIVSIDANDPLPNHTSAEYTQLEDLLTKGLWKEADEKTAEIMLNILGLGAQSSFDVGDLEKIPCADLRTIDQLWVKYSKGHFGLSVQKYILDRVVSSAGGDENAKIEHFGSIIGQYANGNWLNYDNLTFNLSAPQGHLPGLWWRRSWVLRGFANPMFTMASRLVVCKVGS